MDLPKRNQAGNAPRVPGPIQDSEFEVAGSKTSGKQILGFRQKAFTLGALAGQFARTAHGFSLLTRLALGRLLEMVAALHLAEKPFALHLLLQRLQRLIDVVIADHDLHDLKLSICFPAGPGELVSNAKIAERATNVSCRETPARSTGGLLPVRVGSRSGP